VIDFLVIGLPRSGTAWLSVWLDATHDPFGKMLPEFFSGGLVCTGAYLMPDWLEAQTCPVAIIERDHRDCDASLARIGMPPTTPAMRALFARATGEAWSFADLWDEDKAAALWAYLKGTPFDAARYRRLRDLRIEVCDPWKHDADVLTEIKRRGLLAL
jgi:hypothetical protein